MKRVEVWQTTEGKLFHEKSLALQSEIYALRQKFCKETEYSLLDNGNIDEIFNAIPDTNLFLSQLLTLIGEWKQCQKNEEN